MKISKGLKLLSVLGLALPLGGGCGGGGGGGFDIRDLGITYATPDTTITLPPVTTAGACAGAKSLKINTFDITVDQAAGTAGAVLTSPDVTAVVTSATFNPATNAVTVLGNLSQTAGPTAAFTFTGQVNSTANPASISGTLNSTCWKKSITLIARGKGTPKPISPIAGAWRTANIGTAVGSETGCPTTLPTGNGCGENEVFTFGNDGSYSYTNPDEPSENQTGTFTYVGNVLTTTVGTEVATYNVTLIGTRANVRETSRTVGGAARPLERPVANYVRQSVPTDAQLAARPYRIASLATPSGAPQNCPTTLSIGVPPEACGTNDTIRFNANNTYTATVGGVTESGIWGLSGDILTTVSGARITSYLANYQATGLTLAEIDYFDGLDTTKDSTHVVLTLTPQ